MIKLFKEEKRCFSSQGLENKITMVTGKDTRVTGPQAQISRLTQRGLTIVDQNVDFGLPNFDHS